MGGEMRVWKLRRLHQITDKIDKMERELETHEAMGSPAFLTQPEQYQTHLKRLQRFEDEAKLIKRDLRGRAPWLVYLIALLIGAIIVYYFTHLPISY